MDKIFNFLKDHFSVMSGPMDMIFGVGFMDGIFKSYNILNLKSCLKLNNLNKKQAVLRLSNCMYLIELYKRFSERP